MYYFATTHFPNNSKLPFSLISNKLLLLSYLYCGPDINYSLQTGKCFSCCWCLFHFVL